MKRLISYIRLAREIVWLGIGSVKLYALAESFMSSIFNYLGKCEKLSIEDTSREQ
jgi:hypothetical protein